MHVLSYGAEPGTMRAPVGHALQSVETLYPSDTLHSKADLLVQTATS